MRLKVTMTGCCDLVLDGFRDVDVYCPFMSIVGMMLPIPLTRPQETVFFMVGKHIELENSIWFSQWDLQPDLPLSLRQ